MLSISSRNTIIMTILFLFVTLSAGYAQQNSAATVSGSSSASVATDPNTGAANVSVPIEVPPGRNGMAPNLALSYNSNKRNGWIGVGWDIKTSFIQRNTKWGLDYSDDDYVADGNRELLARGDWGTGYYGHKTEGAFIKYFYNSTTGGWEATTKNGTRHYYGSTAASRQDNPNNSSEVFKWMIDKVEDTNGNYVTYTYIKGQGEIYLDQIDYTGGSGLSTTNYVKLYYDDTRTDAYAMYTTNFSVTTTKRLMTIEVVSNSNTVRTYKLVYDADPKTEGSQYSSSTGRSILYSVQQYGTDASLDTSGNVTGGTSLPATTIVHHMQDTTFGKTSPFSNSSYLQGSGSRYVTGDWNGDGMIDIASFNLTSNGNSNWSWLAISNGDGTFSKHSPFSNSSYLQGSGSRYVAGDWNGDGMTDIA
ncbi:MAG: hypothetical protein GY777_15040, partial [Candidatus Brocadiaceae bacterium]|nr:hypothetical protein [Candidatus Brocadiaceae bacterium]